MSAQEKDLALSRRVSRAFFLLGEGSGETSTDWLEIALEEPPFSEARLYCIKQAARLEAPKRGRGRPPKNPQACAPMDSMLLGDMARLAKTTGESKARKLARTVLDSAIEWNNTLPCTGQGDAALARGNFEQWLKKADYSTIVERLAALYRKRARGQEHMG